MDQKFEFCENGDKLLGGAGKRLQVIHREGPNPLPKLLERRYVFDSSEGYVEALEERHNYFQSVVIEVNVTHVQQSKTRQFR